MGRVSGAGEGVRCAILRGVQMEEFVSSTIINGNPYSAAHSLCMCAPVVGVVGSSGSLGDEVGDDMGGPGGFLVEIAEGAKEFWLFRHRLGQIQAHVAKAK